MSRVAPWVAVEPSTTPAAILGNLPMTQGSVSFPLPASVVPAGASGLLLFAWASLAGKNPSLAYWHVASTLPDGSQDWFSLLVAGDPSGRGVVCNSQAFWLPPSASGAITVSLHLNDLPSPGNQGQVEIHGYSLGTDIS
ncbi:MAG: hypothetical protein HY084_08230 [Gemmatimonadetes bacterium]|nr:hypothetical protein [Gemmatimonadota bacterium]